MKIIFDTAVVLKGRHVHTLLRKEFDSSLLPMPGIEIEDSAWKDSKLPLSIVCNFEGEYYLLRFKSVELDTEDQCNQEVAMYRSHGWKKPTEWAS